MGWTYTNSAGREIIRDGRITDEARMFELYDLAAQPRRAAQEAREWLLDCEWAEGDDARERISLLNAVGLIQAVERHYDGGYRQFLADSLNL